MARRRFLSSRLWTGLVALLGLLLFSTLSCPGDASRQRAGLWSWWVFHERFEPELALLFAGVIVWVVYRDRGIRFSAEPPRGWWGWAAGGLALQWAGARLYEPTLCAVGLVVSAAALLGGLGGAERLRRMQGAVVLSLLAIPTIFDPLIFPLQRMASAFLDVLAGAFGWHFYAHGTFIRLLGGEHPHAFEIADACSGISGIRASIAVFAVFNLLKPTFFPHTMMRLVAAGLACGMLVNLVRLILITLVGYWVGARWGMVIHDTVAGYVAFYPILALFMLALTRERKRTA